MTRGKRSNNRSHTGGKSKGEIERKRDERARRNALKKEREAKEYLENDENFVSFSNQLQAVGYKIKDIKGDGNCLFRSLADQLDGDDSGHLRHRRITVKYLTDHREEFEPFVEDNKTFDEHVKELSKPGTYGGNDSIVAFARHHGVKIVIHQLNERCWVIQGQQCAKLRPGDSVRELHISYHNGDHYSSVRRIGDPNNGPAWEYNEKPVVSEQTPARNKEEDQSCQQASPPDVSTDIAIVQAVTGSNDFALIQQSLCESNNDVDATISYILQMQSFMSSGETNEDDSSNVDLCSIGGDKLDRTNTPVDLPNESGDGCERTEETRPGNLSSVSRKPKQIPKANHGARPKIKHQHLSNSKRKQMAKQEKKARRMEERREEVQKKQQTQDSNHETNQSVPTMTCDLEALAI